MLGTISGTCVLFSRKNVFGEAAVDIAGAQNGIADIVERGLIYRIRCSLGLKAERRTLCLRLSAAEREARVAEEIAGIKLNSGTVGIHTHGDTAHVSAKHCAFVALGLLCSGKKHTVVIASGKLQVAAVRVYVPAHRLSGAEVERRSGNALYLTGRDKTRIGRQISVGGKHEGMVKYIPLSVEVEYI